MLQNMKCYRLLIVIFTFLWICGKVIASSSDTSSGSDKRKDVEHEDVVQSAKRRKARLENDMSEYSKTWDEADKQVKLGHSGRQSWMNLRKQQKKEEGIARKYNMYGNILKGDTQVQHGMHRIANKHTQSSKEIQKEMDEVKGKGKVSPTRAQKENEEHYDKLLKFSTEIVKEDTKIHGKNRCRIM